MKWVPHSCPLLARVGEKKGGDCEFGFIRRRGTRPPAHPAMESELLAPARPRN